MMKAMDLMIPNADLCNLFVGIYWCYGSGPSGSGKSSFRTKKPKLLARSSSIKMMETSEWDEKLKVLFPHDIFPLQADSGVSIELWNKGLLGRRVFLGQATLNLNDTSHPPNSVVTLPL